MVVFADISPNIRRKQTGIHHRASRMMQLKSARLLLYCLIVKYVKFIHIRLFRSGSEASEREVNFKKQIKRELLNKKATTMPNRNLKALISLTKTYNFNYFQISFYTAKNNLSVNLKKKKNNSICLPNDFSLYLIPAQRLTFKQFSG